MLFVKIELDISVDGKSAIQQTGPGSREAHKASGYGVAVAREIP